MAIPTDQALQAGMQPGMSTAARPALVVAGATGSLGNEVLRRVAGTQRYSVIHVLAREQVTPTFRGVRLVQVQGDEQGDLCDAWPRVSAGAGIILFEPPRMYHERERALWTPAPADLAATARWMRGCGVRVLAVVMPHDQGRLPAALREGLASLDEHSVASLGFDQLVIVRSAQASRVKGAPAGRLQRLAAWMLGTLAYLVPQSQRPVRAVKVARFVDEALRELQHDRSTSPSGVWIASPEWLWRAAQTDNVADVVREWLAAGVNRSG